MSQASKTKNPNPLLWPHSGLFLITNVWPIPQTCNYHLHFKLPCISHLRPATCRYLFHVPSLHISVWLLWCLTSSSCSVFWCFFFFCLQMPPNIYLSRYWPVSFLLTSYSNTYLLCTRIVPQHPSSCTHSPGEDVAIPLHTQDTLISVSALAHEVRGWESLKCDISCKLWLLSSGNLLNALDITQHFTTDGLWGQRICFPLKQSWDHLQLSYPWIHIESK